MGSCIQTSGHNPRVSAGAVEGRNVGKGLKCCDLSLQAFKATDFRCLAAVELEPDPGFNLIYGDNASGKTSLLEAIGYLGRGRSFRGAPTQDLIRRGATEFVLFGNLLHDDHRSTLGAKNGPAGLQVSADALLQS